MTSRGGDATGAGSAFRGSDSGFKSPIPRVGVQGSRAQPSSDRDDPVPSHIYRQFLVQTLDERRAVLVEEGNEPDRPLLGVAAGEGQRPGVHELTPQG